MEWLLNGCCSAEGSLQWATPLWISGALAVAAGLAWVAAAVGTLRAPKGALWKALELGLTAVGLGVAALAAAGPTWVEEGERREEGRFVVLVDASRSMGVAEASGAPRGKAAQELLARFPDAEVYSFGEKLRPGAPGGWEDGDSDLGGALVALGQRHAGEHLKGIALLTDGIDRSGLRRRLLAPGGDLALPPLPGPLTIYQIGEDRPIPDLSITSVETGGFAFLRAPFTLTARVHTQGLSLREVPVQLTRDGQPAGSQTVRIDAAGDGVATFTLTPDAPGRFIYEVSAPVPPGDAVAVNNSRPVAVRVVRDRVRVLQVAGAPSWDQKFLRLFLKEDPGVDLVSFFILRTRQDFGAGYRSEEMALIPFPYQKLFSSELSSFDLVIFQNFDYRPYFDFGEEALLQNVADYVKNGGALAMIGGDRSFDLGDYAGTPIGGILPVRLGVQGKRTDEARFRPALTPAGKRHPITSLVPDALENEAVWGRISEMDGMNLNLGATKDAAVLLQHPTLTGPDGTPSPVLAIQEVGQGRTMALMADASWRWAFDEAGEGRGNQAYLRFWKNTLRWLIGDPEDRPVRLDVQRENVAPGEEVVLTVQARDIGFVPVKDAKVEVVVEGPGEPQTLSAVAGADGSATVRLPAGARGAYRVRATAESPRGEALGSAQTVFAVSARDPELDEVQPDPTFLRAFAAATGGQFVEAGGWQEPLLDPLSGRVVQDRKETLLYAAPLAPLVSAVCLSLAWGMRRRAGLH